MHPIHLTRFILLITVALFALIVLGLSANFDHVVGEAAFGIVPNFVGYGIALGVITLLVIVPILVIETLRKGAITSLLAVEAAWVFVLWVLWLSEAGLSATNVPSPSSCNFFVGQTKTICQSWSAIVAFSFFNWLILLGWFAALIWFGFKGNHWMSHIPDTELHRSNPSSSLQTAEKPSGNYASNQYPPSAQNAPTPGSVPV